MKEHELLLQQGDLLRAGVIAVDQEGLVCSINDMAKSIFWQTGCSPIGRPAREMQAPPLFMECFCSGMENPGHFITLNGNTYLVASFYASKNNRRTHFIFVFQDISNLGFIYENYSLKSTIFQSVIDCLDDGVMILNHELIPIAVNRSYVKITGLPPSTVLGIKIEDSNINLLNSYSASKMALETRKPYYKTQTTEAGKSIEVLATPIIADKVSMVVCTIKPLTHFDSIDKRLYSKYLLPNTSEIDTRQIIKNFFEKEGIFTESQKMIDIVNTIARIAPHPTYVLISGESGVGKEMLARLIHRCSPRSDYQFVAINCAAVPDSLLESEFFGYEAGAFTGAQRKGKPGLFELANQGTLFLDEVGDFPLSLQAKLLRVLQEGEFLRVGGTKPLKIDVRVVAATNQNLDKMVQLGKFRKDLYYRLKVIDISVPALCERPEDIIPLSTFFLDRFNSSYNQVKRFSMDVLDLFLQYKWPGNVRELRNIVEQLVLIVPEQEILPQHLPSDLQQHEFSSLVEDFTGKAIDFKGKVKLFEQYVLRKALKDHQTADDAARSLGIARSTFFRKLRM